MNRDVSNGRRTLTLTLSATPDQVMVAVEALQRFCRERHVPDDATYALMLALEETEANIVHHAYGRDERRRFHVHVEHGAGFVSIEVRDDGPPFDPLAPRQPLPADDPDEPPIGGHGIELVRRSVDEVRYAREGSENVLRLLKRVPV